MDGLTLDQPSQQPQIYLGDTQVPLDDKVLQNRAAKAEMGLYGVTGQGYDDVYNQFIQGQEPTYRDKAAATIDYKKQASVPDQLAELSKQEHVSPEDVDRIINKPPTNPDTVIEKAYADQYITSASDLAQRMDNTSYVGALQQHPDQMSASMGKANDVLALREYILTQAQNIQPDVDADPYFRVPFIDTPLTPGGEIDVGSKTAPYSSALNWLTLGLYGGIREEYLMRGNTPDTSALSGIFEGSNLRDQGLELLTQPSLQQGKDLFDKAFNRLKEQDPTLAQQWAMSMVGMSNDEVMLRNVMSGLNVAGALGAAKGLKAALEGAGRSSLANLGPAAESEALQSARANLEDVLRQSPASPSKANVAEAQGDITEAAVQKSIVSFTNPDPEKEAVDTLLSMHRSNMDAIRNAPGNLSREQHTRILDAGEASEAQDVENLVKTSRIVRLPELAENGFRDIADKISEYFRGKENTIGDVEIIHDPVSNTEHHVVNILNYDGNNFSNSQLAINHAERNGYGHPYIVGQDPDIVYLPKTAVLERHFPTPDTEEWRPNPNFIIKSNDEGHRFFLGHPDGTEAEVIPSLKPDPTYLPFNLKDGKFEKTTPDMYVDNKGMGYVIKWTIPLDETQDLVRDNLIGSRTTSASTRKEGRITNGIFGYFRLPQDTLSQAEAENRAKAAYLQNRYLESIKGDMQYVENLYHGILDEGNYAKRKSLSYLGNLTGRNAKVWNDFVRMLKVSQKLPDPVTKLPGYFFETPAEIQDAWQRYLGREASFPEQQAYLAFRRLWNKDLIYRSLALYRNKARQGVMSHVLTNITEDGKVKGQPFEGAMVKGSVPEGNTVVAIHDKSGDISYYNNKNPEYKKLFKADVNAGKYRGIKLYSPDKYPLNLKDDNGNPLRVQYVYSNSVESSPISYRQIEYRGGGHWDYAYERYIKQPIVRRQVFGGKETLNYDGDATFAPIHSNKDGEFIAGKLNEIRQLLKDKRVAEAKAVHMSYSDQEWKDFVKNFYPRKNRQTGLIEPATYNLDEDFRVVPRGFTILEHDKGFGQKFKGRNFVDATREGSPDRNFQVEFTGARDSRDLFEPIRQGSVSNPTYKFEPAELTDPVVTMTRALNRIVNSSYMDDYKISAVEHWLQENKSILNEDDIKRMRASPFWYFRNGDLTRGSRGTLQGQIAESNRYKINKFIGMPSKIDTLLHGLKQELADQMFETDSKVKKALLITPTWMLDRIHSPVNFVRSMAFHENLGLFNWMQLAAQNMGWINVFALSPTHAPAAMFGSWMHIWSEVNAHPSILSHLDQLAGTFGWRPGEWQEAREALMSTGFHKIGNTLSIDVGEHKQNFMVSEGKRLLRKGTIFFDMAETNVRLGAWFAAYHEFKRAFPNAVMNDVNTGKVLRRANDMYMNMGRDSKTALNTGVTSMTLQFFKYIENVGQMFFSKRIGDVFGKDNTWQLRARQRAQMILMYSLAFGPAGATGLSLLPTGDILRKKALENGYVPGQDWKSTLLMEGPLAMAGAYLSGWYRTGALDESKGTFYNYNNRYGANGYQVMRDLFEPSNTFWKIILGASGSTMANTLAGFTPFTNAMYSAFTDNNDNPFRLTFDSWKQGLRNINSMRYAERLVYALEFGKWIDRHGQNIQNIGDVDAVFRTILGTNDVKIDDQYLKHMTQQEEKEMYSTAEKEYQYYRRLAEQAADVNDTTNADIYNQNAIFALKSRGVPWDVASGIFARDATLNKESLKRTNDSYYLKKVPTYRQPAASQAYQETYRQNQ